MAGFNPLLITPQEVQAIGNTAQGVERGAAAAIGGAVHDTLGMPQAMINVFYNFGGFVIGNILIIVGAAFVVLSLFGDTIRDAGEELGEALGGNTAEPSAGEKVVDAASKAAEVAAIL